VASYVAENQNEVVFFNVRELAEKTGTSTATVVRFAQAIGFPGYPALLKEVQARLLEVINPTRRLSATLSDIAASTDGEAGILTHTIDTDIASLEETRDLSSNADFVAAVQLLDEARIAYLVGTGLSAGPIGTLAFRLRRLSRPVVEATASGTGLYNTVLPMTSDDLLVAVGFQPIPTEVLRCVELANRRNIPVLAITDTHASSLQEHATITLHAKRGPLTQLTSVVAPVALANALAVALAVRRKDEAAETYDAYEKLTGRDSFQTRRQ
jgi:DNA-binding MurR/RpiR family transcriptional regulator